MWEQCVALEHVAEPPAAWREIDAGRAIEEGPLPHDDPSRIGPDETGQTLQRQRFARPRRPHESHNRRRRLPSHLENEIIECLEDVDRDHGQ
jgi:hypothetical protein